MTSLSEELNPWQSQEHLFDEAARHLNLPSGIVKVLREPNKEIIVHIPVQMDSGDIELFTGYRVQHSIARGPGKGGIRYFPEVRSRWTKSASAWAACCAPASTTS